MLRLLLLSIVQSFCLAMGQVFLKFAVVKMHKFAFTWEWFKEVLTNYWLALTGVSMGLATVLWLYILRHYPLSEAHPLTCLSFIFALLASAFLLHESVPVTRWIGVGIIMVGVFFVAK